MVVVMMMMMVMVMVMVMVMDGDGDFRSIAPSWDLIKTTGQNQSRQHSETLSVLRPLHKNKRQFINSWYTIATRIKIKYLSNGSFWLERLFHGNSSFKG